MKTLALLTLSLFFLAGCTMGTLYYHERSDGARYYQTRAGQLVVVNKDGLVTQAPGLKSRAYISYVQKKGDDWDLSAYDVVEPSGRCVALLSMKPESCFNRIWEAPAMVLMTPILFFPTPGILVDTTYPALPVGGY
jgi:hypothetical protein